MCDPVTLQGPDVSVLDNYSYVVFAGGAIRGISLCAAFCEVANLYKKEYGGKDFVKKLKGTGGTSIGATIALAILCEMPLDQLERLAKDDTLFDSSTLLKNLDFTRFMEEGGLLSYEILYQKIDRLFDLLGLPKDIDFITLHKRTEKLFVCNTSDMEGKEVLYMSYKTTPYKAVRDALCMSMCLPVFFVGFERGGIEYSDGGVYANYIIDRFPRGQVLGFAIDDRPSRANRNLKINGFEKAINVIKNLSNKIDRLNMERLHPDYMRSTVLIYTPGFGQVKVCANKAEACMLWEYGRMSVTWYFYKDIFTHWLLCGYVRDYLGPKFTPPECLINT